MSQKSQKGRTVTGIKWSREGEESEAVALGKNSLLVTCIKAAMRIGGGCVSDDKR